MGEVCIRVCSTPEDLSKVFRLRYDVYVDEMQRVQKYADHESRTVREPLDDSGLVIGAFQDGEAVGTMRMNFNIQEESSFYSEFYKVGELGPLAEFAAVTTKLMTAARYRASGLGLRFIREAYRQGLLRGTQFYFIDCNPHLERLFTRVGFEEYQGRASHPEFGDVLPMIFVAGDLAHMQRVGSPLVKTGLEVRPEFYTLSQTIRTVETYRNGAYFKAESRSLPFTPLVPATAQ